MLFLFLVLLVSSYSLFFIPADSITPQADGISLLCFVMAGAFLASWFLTKVLSSASQRIQYLMRQRRMKKILKHQLRPENIPALSSQRAHTNHS